jgi:hypothetical protein
VELELDLHNSECNVHRKDIDMHDKRLYVERRPEGDYAVRRPDSDRASAVEPTQKDAIERAKELEPGSTPHVERRMPESLIIGGNLSFE